MSAQDNSGQSPTKPTAQANAPRKNTPAASAAQYSAGDTSDICPGSDVSNRVLVAVDFETSGMAAHSACAVGLTRIENNATTRRFYQLLRPPSSRMLFTEIHGLTWADVRDAPTFAEAWPEISAFLDDADFLLAHNASFDRRVLAACCRAAGVNAPRLPFLCTLKGARASLPLPSKKLNLVCEYFGIALQHHNAASDADACAEIYLRLRQRGVSDARMRLG